MKGRAIAALLCFLALCGCSTITFERKVENNTFVSLADPKVQVHISPDFRYIGEVTMARHHQNVHGARNLLVNNNSYLFAHIDRDNILRKGVIIRVDKIKKSSWQPDLFAGLKNKLVADYEEIGTDRYEHFVAVRSDIFTADEMDFIIAEGMKSIKPVMQGERLSYSGYRIPKCFMVEAFGTRAGTGNDTKFCIYYFEDLTSIDERFSCREWIRADMPGGDQQAAVRLFTEARKKGLSITTGRE